VVRGEEAARGDDEEPLIPPAKHRGNKRTAIMREVVNARIDVRTGCRWRAIAKDLAARRTGKDAFIRWILDGTRDRIPMRLRDMPRAGPTRRLRTRRIMASRPSASLRMKASAARNPSAGSGGGPRSTRIAMMRARKSTARSAMSWSNRKLFRGRPASMPPLARIVMAVFC
jgi:transposase